jgi:FAD linked oxidases, C-terminal domain
VANAFHAGDGNLRPLILDDANKPGELERAEAFGNDILRLCVEVGGVLTGEHGVGVVKRDLMETMFNSKLISGGRRTADGLRRLAYGKVLQHDRVDSPAMTATDLILKELARPERLELPTLGFEDRYSIQLSYGRGSRRPP